MTTTTTKTTSRHVREPIRVEAYTAADASKLARQIVNDRWVILSAEPE